MTQGLLEEILNTGQEDFFLNGVSNKKCVPMLKWPGGKRKILKHITPLIPEHYGRYYEPFFGGGALFFAIQPKNSVLSDTNEELINCYKYVRDYPEEVINILKYMKNTKEDYLNIRKTTPVDEIERAARLIYLTTLSFNGIYRLNLKGEFNVPYGYKANINPCDKDKIMSVSKALQNATIKCCDFSDSVSSVKENDFIYFDPPYASDQKNGFVKYNSQVFNWEDQIRLSQLAKSLGEKGCKVVISNADTPEIRELYKGFNCSVLERKSVIAASGEHRKKITECIFYNGGDYCAE